MRTVIVYFILLELFLFCKSSKEEEVHFKEISNILVKFRFVKNAAGLINYPLEGTITDKKGKPVPYAYLIFQYQDHSETLLADMKGVVRFLITPDHLENNPVLKAEKDSIRLKINLRFTTVKQLGREAQPKTVTIAEFFKKYSNHCAVYFKPNYEILADSVLSLLKRQEEYIKVSLDLEPIAFGLVLIDDVPPITLKETRVIKDTVEYFLYPALISQGPSQYYSIGFRAWVKNTLLHYLRLSEEEAFWLYNGLADYFRYRYLNSLNQKIRDSVKFNTFLSREDLEKVRTYLFSKHPQSISILKQKPKLDEEWFIMCQFYLAFWERVSEEFGSEAITRFLNAVWTNKEPSSDTILNLLSKTIGGETVVWLKSFNTAEILKILEKFVL